MAEFKNQYESMPPGPAREALVYQHAISQGPPKMIPINVAGPNNTTITYKVMPDFLMIDGIRISLTAPTAQKIANHFGMQIPTARMADQIYHASNKIPARPLSGSGVTIDGKYYPPAEVVLNLIGNSKANIEYSKIVDQQIANQKNLDPNKPIDGFNKSIVQSEVPGRTGYYGLWSDPNKKPIQGGNGVTPHGLDQSEYCAGLRMVSNDVVITQNDGTSINTNLNSVLQKKQLSSALTYQPGKGTQTYSNRPGPPPGYRSAKLAPEDKSEAESIATSLLSKPMWTEVPITLNNGKKYIAKLEPHSNAPKGVSLYETSQTGQVNLQPMQQSVQTQTQQALKQTNTDNKYSPLLQKITDFINSLT
jgi:hypothetical protein